jgi:hypothetical protein
LDHIDPYKMAMLEKTRVVRADAALDARRCATRVRDRVIAVTRMEYANLFHTSTDWYNVWSAARGLGVEPVSGDALAAVAARAAAAYAPPADRHGRAAMRVALRQLAATAPDLPGLAGLRAVHDRVD